MPPRTDTEYTPDRDRRRDHPGTGRHDRDKHTPRVNGSNPTSQSAEVEGTGLLGTIQKLVSDKGFGFIDGANGVRYFFHRSVVLPNEALFDNLYEGERVKFDGLRSPKGPRCESVVSTENV